MRNGPYRLVSLAAIILSLGVVWSVGQQKALAQRPAGSQAEGEGDEGGDGKVRYGYEDWLKTLEVPVLTGFAVADAFTEKLYDWPSKGGKGVYLRLVNNKMIDGYIIEIPPGGSLKPEKHLYEEFVYFMTGSGTISVQQKDHRLERVEWQAGALFSPPLNVAHQYFNASTQAPARLLIVTSLPFMIQTTGSKEFLVETDFPFRDRYNAQEKFFSGGAVTARRNWTGNFIPSVVGQGLQKWDERGKGSTNMNFDMAGDIMLQAHTSEIPTGMYKLAHRHHNEAIIIQLTGEGYSLLWDKDRNKKEFVRWKAGSIYAPPISWFHQHFNLSDKPARYLAFPNAGFMSRLGANINAQIELKDEDAEVRQIWERETAAKKR